MAEPARALISSHLNEGMVSVIEQRKRGIGFGRMTEFTPGLYGAAVTSEKLKRAVSVLSTRPPFRDATELSALSEEDLISSTRLAMDASGVMKAAIEIGKIVPAPLREIIVSKTGAIALWSDIVREVPSEVHDLIDFLDGGNYSISVNPYPLEIG